MDLTDEQAVLLSRMKRRSLVLTGYETDELRLTMLQVYLAGLVDQVSTTTNPTSMVWRITKRGRAALKARELDDVRR